jgi:hypothetical protein
MTQDSDISDDDRVLFSVIGVIRFDAHAVANALRSRPLSRLEANGLANLLDGGNPNGLHLEMRGQGKGWKPIYETATAYNRLMAIGSFIDTQMSDNNTLEEAVLDAVEEFRVSEATVYRDLRLYRLRGD